MKLPFSKPWIIPGDDLKARAAFYAARLLSAQAKKGEAYGEIKRVYQIFFLNSVLFPGLPLRDAYRPEIVEKL
ncbi:hypothetical protein AGMMS50293_05470 [Spirochaetia bacterium]|nr:hypothetical protein AGMMS50293_05470 [Spirochaetia bacterium]